MYHFVNNEKTVRFARGTYNFISLYLCVLNFASGMKIINYKSD